MANGTISPKNRLLISVRVDSGSRGPIGLTGPTPQLSVANTITGAPYTEADVDITGTELTFTIPQGNPFVIAAEFESVQDLSLEENANVTPSDYSPELFDFVIINTGSVEDEENAKLYIYDGEGPKNGFTFVSDLSGATGPRRELRWKPDNGNTTSILQWRTDNGQDWDEENEKDLGLDFQFDTTNNNLILTVNNSEGIADTVNLTATAEFGTGGENEPTVTSVKFNNNNNTSTAFKELGVYASWDNTKLKLTNPDGTIEEEELALDFDWNETTLKIKNPSEETYNSANEQKLSPDIDFDTTNGVKVSIVEPGAAQDLVKISPDINFQNIGNGLELSIVEPGATVSYSKVSADIDWDGTKLAITEPNTAPVSEDYVELGLTSEFGAGSTTDTTLTITNPDSTTVLQELGVYGEFGEGTTTATTLTLSNPDSTSVVQELGLYADFDETDITKLIITNPDNQTVEQELGLVANFGDGNTNSITTLIVENPNETTLSKELGLNAIWGGEGLTDTTLVVTNPSGANESQELSLQFNWDGTQLGVKTTNDSEYDYVDLKGETGDATAADTPLFKIRDDEDAVDNGYQVKVADEMQIKGTNGILVTREEEIFTISQNIIDGGDFIEN